MYILEKFAALFDWVVAGPVMLFGFAKHYPFPFGITFVGTCLFSFLICRDMEEGPKKIGFLILVGYFTLALFWLIASKLGHFEPRPTV